MEPTKFWLRKAEESKKANKIDEALEYLDKARKLEYAKNTVNFWYSLGTAYSEIKQFEKAMECFDKELELNTPNFETLYQKGIVLYILKKDIDAIECFNKAWEIKYSEYLKSKEQILILKKHKEFEKAIKHSTKLDQMKSFPYKFWHYKGLALANLAKYQEAIECYDEALSIKPDDPHVLSDKNKCKLLQEK